MEKRILTGSQAFFSGYKNFKSKDIDFILFVNDDTLKHQRHIHGKGQCLFEIKKGLTKEQIIQFDLQNKVGMVICNYLVPEFNKKIGFIFADLPKVKNLLQYLDPKHKYLEIIYNAYLENKDFILTEEQRAAAYKSYRESRGLVN